MVFSGDGGRWTYFEGMWDESYLGRCEGCGCEDGGEEEVYELHCGGCSGEGELMADLKVAFDGVGRLMVLMMFMRASMGWI